MPTIVQAANMSHYLLTCKYCSSFSVESEVGGEPMACCVDGISLAEYVYSLVLTFKKQKQLMHRKAFLLTCKYSYMEAVSVASEMHEIHHAYKRVSSLSFRRETTYLMIYKTEKKVSLGQPRWFGKIRLLM